MSNKYNDLLPLTLGRLRELVEYHPADGSFVWIADGITSKGRIGTEAGWINDRGYREIWIDGRGYKAHRLAWLWCYGEMPEVWLDHANGIRTDNRIANLRIATPAHNRANSTRNRARVHDKGAYKVGARWRAIVRVDGKNIHLGYFRTENAAHAAYVAAAREYFGEFANPGRNSPHRKAS